MTTEATDHPAGAAPERVDTPGGSFAYEAAGPEGGPLVLCAHGFPDQPATFRPLASALAREGYRVVAPWLRGYAPSTVEGPFGVGQIAADLVAIARAVSPSRPAAIIGHDWGAVATYEALAHYPGAFSRAVTLAVPHPLAFARNLISSPAQLRRSWYMAFLNVPGSEHLVARNDFAFIDRLWRDWSPGFTPDPRSMRELKACLARSMPAPILYYRALAREAPARLRAVPPKIDVPTLYMHGADDGCVGPAIARGQERFFRAPLRSVAVPGAGHFLHLEAPGEVAREVLDWLSP
jgi:pimeloyl-ACP methyl ester carboxylesterase